MILNKFPISYRKKSGLFFCKIVLNFMSQFHQDLFFNWGKYMHKSDLLRKTLRDNLIWLDKVRQGFIFYFLFQGTSENKFSEDGMEPIARTQFLSNNEKCPCTLNKANSFRKKVSTVTRFAATWANKPNRQIPHLLGGSNQQPKPAKGPYPSQFE